MKSKKKVIRLTESQLVNLIETIAKKTKVRKKQIAENQILKQARLIRQKRLVRKSNINEIFGMKKAFEDFTKPILEALSKVIFDIITKSGLNDPEEILEFIIEHGYEFLPFPIRMIVKKEAFVQIVKGNTVFILKKIHEALAGKPKELGDGKEEDKIDPIEHFGEF
jgi:hypothetical protein